VKYVTLEDAGSLRSSGIPPEWLVDRAREGVLLECSLDDLATALLQEPGAPGDWAAWNAACGRVDAAVAAAAAADVEARA
jgi:hypothetical protein